MSIAPLILAWLWAQQRSTASAQPPPQWPTAASPPPPMPAFIPQPPRPPTADTGTPLAQLHQSPPTPIPASAPQPKPKPKAKPKPQPAARQAADAALRAARGAIKLPGIKLPGISLRSAGPTLRDATVLDLQGIVNARGGKLVRDGLYGPKTANAWAALAKQKGVPTTISRVGPKVARVAAQTYDALRLPAIP